MKQTKLSSILGRLYDVLTAYGAPYPVYRRREDFTKVPPLGVGYWVRPTQFRSTKTPWFSEVQSNNVLRLNLLHKGAPAYPFEQESATLIIFWPVFLRNAFSTDPTNPLQPLAFELLQALHPLLLVFDKVLAHLVLRLSSLSVGQPTRALEVELIQEHLVTLTKRHVFRRALGDTMDLSLRPLRAKEESEALHTCPTGKHRATLKSRCAVCEPYRWMTFAVTILWPHRFDTIKNGWPLELRLPPNLKGFFEAPGYGPWDQEFQWMLSCVDSREGAVPLEDGTLLVNFNRLRELSISFGRESILTRFHGDAWSQGVAAREDATKHAAREVAIRKVPLIDLAAAHHWEVRDTIDQPYELFNIEALKRRFNANARLLLRKAPDPRRRVSPRPLVWLEYPDLEGNTHLVYVLVRNRRGRRILYFSVPFPAYAELDAPKADSTYRFGETRYWSLHGFINQEVPSKLKEEAAAFEVWLARQDSALHPREFKRILYEQRRADRLAAITRGEMHHLASYSSGEDQEIARFALDRKFGAFTKAERSQLLTQLPGRAWMGVKRRFEMLALQYAQQHGWEAYLASGWRSNNSAKRYKQWRKEGVR